MAKVTEEKMEALKAFVGEENAEAIVADAEEYTKALEKAGAEFKEKADGDSEEGEEEDEEEAEKTEEKEADENVMELELDEDLMKEIASHVDVTDAVKEAVGQALKEMLPSMLATYTTVIEDKVKEVVEEANLNSAEDIVQKAITGRLHLKPFTASKDAGNVIPEGQKDAFEEEQKTKGTKGNEVSVVGRVVQRMLSN